MSRIKLTTQIPEIHFFLTKNEARACFFCEKNTTSWDFSLKALMQDIVRLILSRDWEVVFRGGRYLGGISVRHP